MPRGIYVDHSTIHYVQESGKLKKMARKCSENLYRAIRLNAQELASTRSRAEQRIKDLERQRQTLLELLAELSVNHEKPDQVFLRPPAKRQTFFEESKK